MITYFGGDGIPVFLLNVFAKNEKTDLAPDERRTLKSVLADVARTYRRKKDRK